MTLKTTTYDAWYRAKVQDVLDDPRSTTLHSQGMERAQAMIDEKRVTWS